MTKFILTLLFLFGLSGCMYGDPGEDTMAQRTLENKEISNPAALTPVVAVTPSNGWWTGSGNLGVEKAFAPDAQNRQTILSLPEIGHPEIWTVSLYTTNALVDFNAFSVKARIEFGAGGSTQIVEMDWLNGAQISLPMNALNVIAEYDDVDVTTAGSGIRLGVQVSKGRRGGNQPPRATMLENINLPNGVFPTLIPIPAFASRIKIVPNTVGDIAQTYSVTTVLILFSGNGAGAFVTDAITGDLLLQNDGIEVSGSARYAKLVNLNAAAINVSMFAELFG